MTQKEAIRIYLLGDNCYNVDPPDSLAKEAKKLSIGSVSGTAGRILHSEGELLLWIEEVARLKQKSKK